MYLYLTVTELKSLTNLQNNVDEHKITGAIKFAQESKIEGLIGFDLNTELQEQLLASAVTSLNQTLIDDYIKIALAYWTLVEGYYDLHYMFTNKGIVTKNSDPQSATLGSGQLENYRQYLKDRAEFYGNKMLKYLSLNKTSYPLYNTYSCSSSGGNSNFGIYIPDRVDPYYKDDIRRFLD